MKFRNVAYLDNTLGGVLGTRNENNLQLSMSGKKSINSKILSTDHILQANKNEYPQALQKQIQPAKRWSDGDIQQPSRTQHR